MSGTNRSATRPGASTILACCGAAALAASAALLTGHALAETPVEQWRLAARYTARLSFPILLLVLVASSWHRLAPSAASRFVLQRRRAFGLAFATAHTIHLGALVSFNVLAGEAPDVVTLVAGGGGYLMMFAMAATSNDASVRRLGRNWVRLHKVGIYWLWFVFAASYAGRVAAGRLEFAPFLALLVAALGVRIAAARVRNARKRDAPARTASQQA